MPFPDNSIEKIFIYPKRNKGNNLLMYNVDKRKPADFRTKVKTNH